MKNIGKAFKSIFFKTFAVLMVLMVISPSVANAATALSSSDQDAIDNDTVHYIDDYAPVTGPCMLTPTGAPQIPGPVYFVGDSIGQSIQPNLQASFATAGFGYAGNGLSSRNLSGGSATPDGLGQIDVDQAYIATAKYVVIELGTNASGFTANNVNAMISKIRALTPTAKIYWVDTAVSQKDSYAPVLNAVNTIIYNQASPDNYSVISWNKKVFGASADPLNMAGQTDSNGYISTTDGINVHLTTPAGKDAMVSLITTTVTTGLTSTPAPLAGDCACVADTLTSVDGSNEQKIWFYLLGKGLTPTQAAGIMGNMQAEAHFEPRLVEYGFLNSRDEISRQNQPSSLDDNVPPNRNKDGTPSTNGQPGYGIVQFTAPTYKQALRDISSQKSIIAGDLNLQLDYLWQLLTTPGSNLYKNVLLPIKATTTVEQASDIFLTKFEIPAGIDKQLVPRRNNGLAILAALGTLEAPPSSAGGGCGSGGGGVHGFTAPGLNGYTIPCQGQPAAVKRLAGPRADWTGVKDSGIIGTNSGDQPMKVYIREACDSVNIKTVIVVGSIHGSENGGQLVAWELLFNAVLPSNMRVIAVPELNGTGIPGGIRKNANGVDLNRNEDFNWNFNSSSSCSEAVPSCTFYRGPSPASEPETKAIDAILLSVGRVDLFTIYHDNLEYIAPVGNTPVSVGKSYAALVGMHGQCPNNPSSQNCPIITVTQHGSLDGWYNARTGSPTILVELSSNQSAATIQRHVDAIVQMFKDGTI